MTSHSQERNVQLQPIGRRIKSPPGKTLLSAAQSVGVELQAVCGGVGTCGHCKVRLTKGFLSEVTAQETELLGPELLALGQRLACQAIPESDITVEIPPESLTASQRVQIDSNDLEVPLDPSVIPIDIARESSSLEQIPETISIALGEEVQFAMPMSNQRHNTLPQLSGPVRAAIDRGFSPNRIVSLLETQSSIFGLAVDLGTTKLAAYLVDLETGKTAAQRGLMNPQIAFGEDVVSRLTYASQKIGGSARLQSLVIEALNQLVGDLCSELSITKHQIVEMVVAGNTAMHHFFTGLPTEQLGQAPYLPATTDPLHLSARSLGLQIATGAGVYTPPNIAGYVGSDHVAMLIGIDASALRRGGPFLAIDIGTNTEITLGVNGRLLTCSCASGPAFEGAHIRHGMRALPGAIERVRFEDKVIQIYTIERRPPIGLCGSGILDAIAGLLSGDVIDSRGNFHKGLQRVQENGHGGEFLLVDEASSAARIGIVLTRQDISEIQFAKAAIRAGIEVLLDVGNISASALEDFVVAGAFGSYLDLRSAMRIGLFPQIELAKFRQIGNAAGSGAKQMLISRSRRSLGESMAKEIEYIELANHPTFQDKFAASLLF